jgi:BASS family bile acid:Na+ symporter
MMFQRLLLVWLTAFSALAFFWPALFASAADPFGKEAGDLYLKWLIVITMFAIGILLPRAEVNQVLRRWPTVLVGICVQYSVMPLLAFLAATIGGFEGSLFIGIVVVGCVPGAMASNVLTLNAKGNTSYSVSLTTVATLLSPLAVPVVLGLALASEESVNREKLIDASGFLLLTVVVPVVLGHLIGRSATKWEKSLRRWSELVANIAILWIIAAVVGRSREPLSEMHVDVVFALLAVNIAGYFAGYSSGVAFRFSEPMRRALTLEVGMQNAGLGAALAVALFPNQPGIAVAPAIYTFGCMLTGTALATAWSIAPPRGIGVASNCHPDGE